ncbi:MAG: RNA 2',3'-cyclic phosphodiesterase [Actinomycetia bacterium]|nr:RNA 2',3'-cyclic phosphodiesterase [Actinomycetes bacterium]
MSPHATRRVFLGFPRPPEADPGLEAAQRLLLRAGWRGRPTARAALHVTLLFAGEVDAATLDALAGVAGRAAAGTGAARLVLDHWALLPRREAPRVLAAAASRVPPPLAALYRALREETRDLLVAAPVPPGAFLPHVTLMRRRPDDPPGRTPARPPSIVWPVDRLVLWESHLRPEGPRYEEIAAWPLGTKKAAAFGRPDGSGPTAD